jgi:predicted ATP-dependent Lon-type protease
MPVRDNLPEARIIPKQVRTGPEGIPTIPGELFAKFQTGFYGDCVCGAWLRLTRLP